VTYQYVGCVKTTALTELNHRVLFVLYHDQL